MTKTEKQYNGLLLKFLQWEMNGYDTPYLTYHEQLDIFKEHIELLEKKIKEEKMK